jgi:hypothetical protein
MSLLPTARQIWRMGPRNRRLLAEALLALVASSLAVRILPFRTIAQAATRGRSAAEPALEAGYRQQIEDVRWSVEAMARRLPWRVVCFQKGLAAHFLLRRRGVPTLLHYGIDNRQEDGLRAHVWVTSSAGPVIGAEIADQFTCVATFPPTG